MRQEGEHYLIDTTPLSGFLSNRPNLVSLMTPWIRSARAWTSILVYGEAFERIVDHPDFNRHDVFLADLLRVIRPIPIDEAIMRRYAFIRRGLRRTNDLIGDIDTLIAATAQEFGLTIVSMDGHFTRVPGVAYILLDRQSFRPAQRHP